LAGNDVTPEAVVAEIHSWLSISTLNATGNDLRQIKCD
jgi:hypothetical protein